MRQGEGQGQGEKGEGEGEKGGDTCVFLGEDRLYREKVVEVVMEI